MALAQAPNFAPHAAFGTGNNPRSVAIADVNGDGKPDMLVANYGSGNVGVLLNTTATSAVTASFAVQATFAAGATPQSVAAADVNGDGRSDILVTNSNSDNVSVLLNTGMGMLAAEPAALAAQVAAYPSPARGTLTVRRPAGPAAETAVDVAGLAPGVYALRLTVAGQVVARHLVLD